MKNESGNMIVLVLRILFWLVLLIGSITILFWLLLKPPNDPQALAPTSSAVPTPTSVSPSATSTLGPQLLRADFEQPGAIMGYPSGGNWSTKVVDGNGVLEIHSDPNGGPGTLPSIDFGSGAWTNYVFSFRFKVAECNSVSFFGCAVIVNFRNEAGQAYVLIMDTNTGDVRLEFGSRSGWISFDKGITDMYVDLPLKTWHEVSLTVDRDSISASVDSIQTTIVSDDRLKTGSVGIIVGASTAVEFDNINAWSIPSDTP